MPKNTIALLSLLLVLALPLAAADAAPPKGLLEWGSRMVSYCPNETFELTPAAVPAPAGFTAWTLSQTSSWGPCAQRVTLFASATQAIAGRALPLPADTRPLDERIAERARAMFDTNVAIRHEKGKLPDGLRRIRLEFETPEGPLPISAFLDSAAANLVIGVRGTIGQDPAQEVLRTLSSGAASRGAKGAKVVVLEIADLQCPACATLHQSLEPLIAKRLGEIEFRRIDLPINTKHDWSMAASTAGQAILKLAPAKYWDYVDYMFKRQPDLTAATVETAIQDFAEGHELDWPAIRKEMRSPQARRAQTARLGALFSHGIFGTPKVLVNGRITPHDRTGVTVMEYIEKLLEEGS